MGKRQVNFSLAILVFIANKILENNFMNGKIEGWQTQKFMLTKFLGQLNSCV